MRLMSRQELRCKLEKEVINSLTLNEIKKIEKELYPYFKHIIEEENAKLKAHLLMSGKFELLEEMSKEEERLLKEGWGSTIADIGITAGQMIGGGVGQVAGIAGLVKYVPEFQNNIDKSFLEWFGPFISLFFSAQALLFPMPAVASLKGILTGFVSGVKGILTGTGGILSKGVSALFAKGSGFITKMIELLKSAIAGITKAAAKGGPTFTKIETKLGGSGVLSGALKALEKAGEEVVKRFNVIKEGLIKYGSKLSPANIKEILKKAFQTSKDKLDDAAKFVKDSGGIAKAAKAKAGSATTAALSSFKSAIMKASQGGREALSKFIRDYMSKNVTKMNELLKPLVGKSYGQLGEFTGLTTGGAFKFAGQTQSARSVMTVAKSGNSGTVYIDKILNQKLAGNLIKDLIAIKDPLIDILLKAFSPFMPRVATELSRIAAASQGGGFDDFDKESYMSPIKSKPEESEEKEKENIEEIRRLNSLIYHSRRNSQVIRERKIINLI